MIRKKLRFGNKLRINKSVEGEHIETKVERVVHNNEPIKDGAPLIYTERKEGVRAETNIKTDRFEVAINAMDKVASSRVARRENKAEMKVEKGGKSEPKDEPKKASGSGGSSEGEA